MLILKAAIISYAETNDFKLCYIFRIPVRISRAKMQEKKRIFLKKYGLNVDFTYQDTNK